MKNQLRVLRAERQWSQGDLAEKLGVSRQTVNATLIVSMENSDGSTTQILKPVTISAKKTSRTQKMSVTFSGSPRGMALPTQPTSTAATTWTFMLRWWAVAQTRPAHACAKAPRKPGRRTGWGGGGRGWSMGGAG